MEALCPLILVVGVIGFAIIAIVVGAKLEKDRTAALRRIAEELGFDFHESYDSLATLMARFHIFSQGRSKKVKNLLRAKTEDLIQHLLRQPVPLRPRQRNILLPDQLMNHGNELLLGSGVLVHLGDRFQIQTLDESLVHCGFDFLLKFQGDRPRGSHDGGSHPIVPTDC